MSIQAANAIDSTAEETPAPLTPLTALHIGNIANNAYLNAALLNRAGFDCDVLVYDYYHIMGCPEWEDADFDEPLDEFEPDWSRVNLNGFVRPEWFAQGPADSVLAYLKARRQGHRARAAFLRRYSHLAGRIQNISRYARVKGLLNILRRMASRLRRIPYLAKRSVVICISLILAIRRTAAAVVPAAQQARPPSKDEARIEELIHQFREAFPDRSDQLTRSDFDAYRRRMSRFRDLFENYDVIHCYGTDPIWGMLAGNRPYVAFEHSTIRHLPFTDSALGRLTALAYRLADCAIITNCDCKSAADRLGMTNYRFVPHPLNERWLAEGMGASLRESLVRELDADFICFHPPRQHWHPWRELVEHGSEEDPSWYKGNDIFYEGFARFQREVAPRAAIVTVAWGAKLAESKRLLDRLGIASRVKWIPPQPCRAMLRTIDACDLLVDQFWVGAFGTTMPKAMPLGKPAMCHVDPAMHESCLEEMPPIINAHWPDDVYEGLRHAYEDRDALHALGRAGRAWYDQYHSGARILNDLNACYIDARRRQDRRHTANRTLAS